MEYLNLLNVQSCYNFLNSNIRINDYIDFLEKNNLKFGFYSDEDTMYGAFEFYKKALNKNIKPIIGLNVKLKYGTFLIYAKNINGYKKISLISSLINDLDNTISREDIFLENISNDMVIVSISKNINQYISQIKNKINEENFYNGITKENYEVYKNYSNVVFAKKINFLYKEDFIIYKLLRSIDEGKIISEVVVSEKNFYLSKAELNKYIDINKHEENINKIISLIDFENIFNFKKHFLKFNNDYNLSSKDYLKKICNDNLKKYLLNKNLNENIYIERLNYELDVINKMEFDDYFLIVNDMLNQATKLDILYGPGRGSAAGSLVSFLLNITKLDPIQWNLLFERFLNVERSTLPDIDIDFQDNRREEILNYLYNKYGKSHFALITTFQTIGVKNAIRDCGKAFNISNEIINNIIKEISENNFEEKNINIKDFDKLKIYVDKFPDMFNIVDKLVGLPRQVGTHAAGVVFCDEPLQNVVPTKTSSIKILQTQFSMEHLEEIGLIKTDILGLKNLTIINEILNTIKENENVNVILNDIPLNDKKTFNLLNQGNTSGIFQLESYGMTKVIKKINISCIEDISLASALYRPGPQKNISILLDRKIKKVKFDIDKNLEEILTPTFGIIVYQEQIMQILQKISKMSLNKADIIRRAISKKNSLLMNTFKEEFILETIKNNYTKDYAEQLWKYIEDFALYGFNRSHAICYSIISYWMSYLKANFKLAFYSVILNYTIGNKNKTSKLINELKKENYKIKTPTIKNPYSIYSYKNNNLFVPLTEIKNINFEFADKIYKLYQENNNFVNNFLEIIMILNEFSQRKEKYLSLVNSGAIDYFSYNKKDLVNYMNQIFNLADIVKKLNINNLNLFFKKEEIKNENNLNIEKEYLGFYISNHFLEKIRSMFNKNDNLKTLSSLMEENIECDILVNINEIRIIKDKNNKDMAFVEVSDESDKKDLTVFSKVFEIEKDKLLIDKNLIMKIKTEKYNNKISLSLKKIIKIL